MDSGRVIGTGREEYNQNLLCACMNKFSINKNITLQNSESYSIISQKSMDRLALVPKKRRQLSPEEVKKDFMVSKTSELNPG